MSSRLRWFLPENPDILELLRRQAEVTRDGLSALARWSESGIEADSKAVRDAEHDGDDLRRQLLEALTSVLTAPIDQEDAYELAERIDEVLDRAKDVVRLAKALDWKPDLYAAAMAGRAAESVGHVCGAVGSLHNRHSRLDEEVELAIKSGRQIEHELLVGLDALNRDGNLFELSATLEIYRAYSAIGRALERVAARIRYAALKML